MIELLTTISLVSGGILFLLLLLSLLGGLDLDVDVDADADGLGIFKSVLTFVSMGAWVVKLMLVSYDNPALAFTVGAAAGAVGVWVMSQLLKLMLRQESNVNFKADDALFQQGKVYLKIPGEGQGLVNVRVKGRNREFKATAEDGLELPTGTPVEVVNLAADGSIVVRQLA
ncbi:hypothetical protein [Neolewinella antarctica]|uniref:Membrane protein implicated in regulation of membrane protease activity n=1 Tax=Neolewinella antarctica TaxID=442734 RepID=A0ABX0XDC1_9BACT|nr:hypothetical protein [Neolewinella antarctica]NJC26808.1 membrane protein implicated in regulation of membrane protease activity [Neolewinella antarctica]